VALACVDVGVVDVSKVVIIEEFADIVVCEDTSVQNKKKINMNKFFAIDSIFLTHILNKINCF
jgi:hypothetical protein